MSDEQSQKYFLYIPVWATGNAPAPSSSSESSSTTDSVSTNSTTDSVSTNTPSIPTDGTTDSVSTNSTTDSVSTQTPTDSSISSSSISSSSETDSTTDSVSTSGDETSDGGTSGGGDPPGGTSGGGGTSGSGDPSSPSESCFLFGTLVKLADGEVKTVEALKAGDKIASVDIPGMERDANYEAQYHWMSTDGLDGLVKRDATVGKTTHGQHSGYFVINGRVKATFEHPMLVRRGDDWGFCSIDRLVIGDLLINEDLMEERIYKIQQVDGLVDTVSLYIPETNMYVADGVFAHNNVSFGTGGTTGGSSSGPIINTSSSSESSSNPSGSKSSGSSASLSGSGTTGTPGFSEASESTSPFTGGFFSGNNPDNVVSFDLNNLGSNDTWSVTGATYGNSTEQNLLKKLRKRATTNLGELVLQLGSNYATSTDYVNAYSPGAFASIENTTAGETIYLTLEATNASTSIAFKGSTADGDKIIAWSSGDSIVCNIYNSGQSSALPDTTDSSQQ